MFPARDPRTWKLEGSTDGKTWTLLDEHKDEPLFAKRHETRILQDREAGGVPVLPLHVHAEPGRHAFPGGRDRLDGVAPPALGAGCGGRSTRGRSIFARRWRQVVYKEAGVRFTREHFISAPTRCSSRV